MKGFVTLATGNIHYYQLACNLLKSYRYRGGKYPFAILCDRANEYTRTFEKVIILENPDFCYLDKFKILIDSPFEENIFIETDCLAYKNLDIFWDYFKNATDFSSFGWNHGSMDIFLCPEDIEQKFHIQKIPVFCPGYLYVRKGPVCEKIYKDCLDISNYIIANKTRHPKAFIRNKLHDDPVWAIAMELNSCTCVVKPSVGKCINYPSFNRKNHHYPAMNFLHGYLEDNDANSSANLCHYSNKHTKLGKYHQQVAAMNCYLSGHNIIGRIIENQCIEKLFNIFWKMIFVLNRFRHHHGICQ